MVKNPFKKKTKVKEKEKEEKITPKESAKPADEEKDSEQEEDTERLKPKDTQVKEPSLAPAERDYLRQYQYKKVNGNPAIGGFLTDPDVGSKAAVMKENLLSQPRVSIFIPRVEGEDPKVTLSVNLNGYRLDLPKQVYLELPKQVAEVIMESQRQQVAALKPFLINRDKGTEEALS